VNVLAWVENQLLLRLALATADKILVSHPGVEAELRRRGGRPEQIVVTGYGLSSTFADLSPHEKQYDAIFIGRFSHVKGIPKLLDAWKIVTRTLPAAKLALVGSSSPEFNVYAEMRSRNLTESNVVVLTGLDDASVQDALKSSIIFVTASEEEGYGLSVAEALSCGLPSVTFDIPAFRHFFRRGRVIPVDNSAAAFARITLRLLTDAAFRSSVTESIAAGGSFQTWDEVADEIWKDLFEN
jgi:glycosyltransferase involved in cell wall biosynthesis